MAECLSDPEAVIESVMQPRRLDRRLIVKLSRLESKQSGICQLVHCLEPERADAVHEPSITNICKVHRGIPRSWSCPRLEPTDHTTSWVEAVEPGD